MRMHLILYLLVPLVIASDVNSGQRTRDASRPQRRNQRRAKFPTSTTTTEQIDTTGRAIEIFKFELADAKIPDFQPQQRYQTQQTNAQQKPRSRQRKSRKPDTTQTTNSQTDNDSNDNARTDGQETVNGGDQSGADSRLLHVTRPTYELQRQRGMKQMPFSVAKAINHALKQDFNIPLLETIKYYFKDPAPKTTKLSNIGHLPPGAKLFSDSRIKQWWQLPPYVKTATSATQNVVKISSSTVKPGLYSDTTAAPLLTNEYVAYPLLRSYPVQYSMNVASDLVNGVGFLYGDRIYSKPFTYQKNVNQVNSLNTDIKPVVEPKPVQEDEIITGIYRTTPSSITSTSPVVFPTSSESPKSYVKYYTAKLSKPSKNDENGVPLSTDKNTINLINKAVKEIQKHNPHLDVVPKRIENDELVVHVTPKPDYLIKSTTLGTSTTHSHDFKDTLADKNLVYLNKIEPVKSTEKPITKGTHHAYVTHIEVPTNLDDFLEQGYAFGYRVRDYHTGNDFGHTQKRMTDGTTMGEYKILMPDGRMQNVKYKADDNGYHADVSYDV